MKTQTTLREVLGALPFAGDVDWKLLHRDHKIQSRFNLEYLRDKLPEVTSQLEPFIQQNPPGKNVFVFASSHLWIIHTVISSLALRGFGHGVTLGFLPYGYFNQPVSRLDLRLQDLYARDVLKVVQPLIKVEPFLDVRPENKIPLELGEAVDKVTFFDTQYILQREDVSGEEPIYRLRRQRNNEAARRALTYFRVNRPDVVLVPNGMIQEYGAIYETARFLGIPAVTFEFSELERHIWVDQNRLVMLHLTDELWAGVQDRILDEEQKAWLESFLAGRQGVKKSAQFAHLYQKAVRTGGEKIRAQLGLDERPVVLLPTNVLGDSATLGRTLFSRSMADWIECVVRYFAGRPEIQLVIRIHPAETWTVGPSVAEIIHAALPELPAHFHLIGPKENVNTYDLMEIADLALVYTTTAGLEMATRGIPVLVSGLAQYRKKGFTLDADTWDEYFDVLDRAIKALPDGRLTPEQVERAWNYAYFYFKEYPRPFPWHLERIGPDMQRDPLSYVLSPQGRAEFEKTFQQLVAATPLG
ncbi:MAG TPA: hypothetical protein VMC09_01065 [Anaerolineales bacterium]|nr:hypothetical protein [Anaerolineales bacterium]